MLCDQMKGFFDLACPGWEVGVPSVVTEEAAMKILLVILALLAAERAEPRDTAKPAVTLAVAAYSSATDRVAPGPGLASLQVEEVWIALKEIRFDEVASCRKAAGAAQVKGAVVFELVAGAAIGLPERLAVGQGSYCGLELTLR